MYVAESEAGFYAQARRETGLARALRLDPRPWSPNARPDLCETHPRFVVLPHGVLPAYAQCLTGYTPMPGVPAPIVVLER